MSGTIPYQFHICKNTHEDNDTYNEKIFLFYPWKSLGNTPNCLRKHFVK